MNLLRSKPLLGVAVVLVLAAAGWLAFGYFGIQAAFIDDEVNEAGPVFDATEADQDGVASTEESPVTSAEANQNLTQADESIEDTGTDSGDQIITVAAGDFSGQSRYTIVGRALVLNDGGPQRFLRFEDFESDNGPDLKVYLRAANGDFVNLGDLKGNIGDQNYEIPPEVDLAVFDTVEIWCERFGVGFGSAPLTQA